MHKILLIFATVLLFISCGTKTAIESPDKEIVIGTFNIKWLGDGIGDNVKRTDADYERIANIISESEVDVLGVQEIENDKALEKLMQHLPDHNFLLGNSGGKLNLGVIYKKDIEITEHGEYMPIAVQENRTRPGFYISARKGNFDWKMMVVHFKSTSRYDSTEQMRIESYALRKLQAAELGRWVDSVMASSGEKDIILTGDFNDNPSKRGKNLQALIDTGISFISADLTSCKNIMWSSIDHIAVTPSAQVRYRHGSVTTHNFYKALTEYEADLVSDHCPVLAVFDLTAPDND